MEVLSKVSGTQWWGHYIKCGFQVMRGSPPLRPYPDDEDDEIADAQVEDGGENGEVSPLPTTVAASEAPARSHTPRPPLSPPPPPLDPPHEEPRVSAAGLAHEVQSEKTEPEGQLGGSEGVGHACSQPANGPVGTIRMAQVNADRRLAGLDFHLVELLGRLDALEARVLQAVTETNMRLDAANFFMTNMYMYMNGEGVHPPHPAHDVHPASDDMNQPAPVETAAPSESEHVESGGQSVHHACPAPSDAGSEFVKLDT